MIYFFYYCCSSIHIRNELIKHGWCSHISHHLTTINHNNFDQIEKLIMAMIPLTDACRIEFVTLLPILDKLNDIYGNNSFNQDSLYIDISSNLQNLRKNLQQISSIDL